MCCPRGCGEPRRPRGDLAPEHPAGVRGRVVEDDVGRRRVSQDLQKNGGVSFYFFTICLTSRPGMTNTVVLGSSVGMYLDNQLRRHQ